MLNKVVKNVLYFVLGLVTIVVGSVAVFFLLIGVKLGFEYIAGYALFDKILLGIWITILLFGSYGMGRAMWNSKINPLRKM